MEQDFKDWIGRSMTRKDVVTDRILAQYRATMSRFLYDPEPGICPPGLHFGMAPATPMLEETGPDGAERKGLFVPPIPLPRRMWAGGSIENIRPVKADARFERSSTHRRHPHDARKFRRALPRLHPA